MRFPQPRGEFMPEAALLKAATRRLVSANGGPLAAACAAGSSEARISAYGALAQPDRFMRIDQVTALEAGAEWPHVTAMLAQLSGFRLVLADLSPGAAVPALAEMLSASGAAVAEGARALADGRLGDKERARLLPLVQRLTALCAATEAALAAPTTPED